FEPGAAGIDAKSRHVTQYFEMLGNQGLYNDGWMLSAVPARAPWQLETAAVTDPATAFKFELFDLKNDWTQFTDVAAQHTQKMQEMRDLMFEGLPSIRSCRSTPRPPRGSLRRVPPSRRPGMSTLSQSRPPPTSP